ncbi:E3 ubiquitin-protein ligase hrd1 [Coemansia sp. RSA 2598]|nr:E3 ubiquitin-protein ligase hrd1 [Coemansia sp. RSA 2598]
MTDANRRILPRLATYGLSTTALTAAVFATAFTYHEYFYTACIQLSQSGAAMLILANMGLFLTILLGRLLVRLFFGQLRAIEVERLYEQGWFSITETFLALAVLRDQFDVVTLTLFVFLLFCKIFHWMLEDRVSFMEQQTRITKLFFARTLSLSAILAATDCLMLMYSVESTLKHDATMMIVFAFEYMLLLVRFMSTCAKFVLNTIDVSRNGEWEEKQSFVFYVELAHDAVKLLVYLGFFFTLTLYYRLPIHILRELYITARSLVDRCRDWVRYRKAMRNMHLRYPTVSQDELDTMNDTTCIICREDMAGPSQEQADLWNAARQTGNAPLLSGDTPKKLPCGHVFHFNCLRNWLERQQSCPTCRQSVVDDAPSEINISEQQQHQHPHQPIVDPHAQTYNNQQANEPVNNHGHQQPSPHSGNSAGTSMANPGPADGVANEAATRLHTASTSTSTSASASALASALASELALASTTATLGSSSNRTAHTQQRDMPQPAPHFLQTGARPHASYLPLAETLIPVFPSSPAPVPSLGGLPLLQDFPSPDLSMLSDEHIKRLEADSRTAVAERIRILSALQVQLSHMVVALTQVESLIPTNPTSAQPSMQTSRPQPTEAVAETEMASQIPTNSTDAASDDFPAPDAGL